MDQVAVSISRHWFWHKFRAVRDYGDKRAAILDANAQGTQQAMPAPVLAH